MSDPLALVYEFEAQLDRFADLTEERALVVLKEVAETTLKAITVGNSYGPGAPRDTGWLSQSFAVGLNEPAATETQRPFVSRKVTKPGTVVFSDRVDPAKINSAKLGDIIYLTTATEYGQYLEFEPKARRWAPGKGSSTVFLEPVEARFTQIMDDTVARVRPA